jgi:CHAT domain-containing protein/tetratricopeptide (TPR) repeat protein
MRAAGILLVLAALAAAPAHAQEPLRDAPAVDPEARWQQLNDQTRAALGRGEYDTGAELAARALAFAEANFGPHHLHILAAANNLAFAHDARGRYAEAEPLYLRAIGLAEKALGPDHPETLVPVNNLALLYAKQGRYKEAEPLYRRAVEGATRQLGEDHPNTLIFLSGLANLLGLQGRYAESLPLYEKGLKTAERALGPDDPTTLTYADSLASLYQRMGRLADADALFVRALAGREKILGPDHPYTLMSVGNLALLKSAQGKVAEAEALLRRSLAGRERALGADHPDTMQSVTGLAQLYEGQGRFAEAEKLHARALAARERTLGPDHPDTLVALNNLALVEVRQGRYAEAEPLYKRVLEMSDRVLGREHPDTLFFLTNAAMLMGIQGRYVQAEALYRRALEARERRMGREHPDTLQTVANLGALYVDMGRPAEAEPLFLRALEGGERASGRDHAMTLVYVNNLAALYDSQERYAEAEPLLRRAVESAERMLGPEHPETLQYVSNLAVSYARQKRDAEAEPLLRRVLAGREKALGPEHRATVQALANLGSHYRMHGRYDEAEPLLRRAAATSERAFGPGHPDTLNALGDIAGLARLRGRAAEAEPLYERLVAGYDRALGPEHPESIRAAARLAYMRLGHPPRAAAALDPARRVVASLRSRRRLAAADPFAQAQAEREQAERGVGYLLFADAAWAKEPGALAAEVFTALQDSAAGTTDKAVVRMAVRRLADEAGAGLGALARQREDLGERWAANGRRYSLALATAGGDAEALRGRLRSERGEIEAAMDAVDRRLRSEFPAYFDLVRPEAVELAAVQQLLAPDEALLLVVPAEFGTHVVAVSRAGSRWVRSAWNRSRTDEAVRRLLWDVGASVEISPGQALLWEQAAGPGSYDRKTAFQLYGELIAPVESVLAGKRHVFIAAAGSLSSLPFGILVAEPPQGSDSDPEALRGTKWFADAHALVQIPSVQSLQFLRRYGGGRAAPDAAAGFVGFGDPALRGRAEARGRGRGGAGKRSGAAIADVRSIGAMNRLPGTAVELENLRLALGAPRESVFLAERATEARLRSMDLTGARIIALATHGLMAGEAGGAGEPGLVFTPPAVASAEEDGLLTASEVAALRLDADWVIMSACNTAAGDGSAGAPGLSGLARAFFYAGARNLLASHWPVGDDVAPRLTVRTLQLLKEMPALSRAEAFQRAMREVREDPSHDGPDGGWAHPAAWAPFSLIGDAAR